MCCFFAVLVFLGPRAAILVWWLIDMDRWSRTFDTFIWPLVGAIFAPWTLLAYVAVYPGGIIGFDWLWLGIGIFLDFLFYVGGGFRRRFRR
jgi:hypothetical protein